MTKTMSPPAETEPSTTGSGRSFNVMTILLWTAVIGILALVGWGLIRASATRPEVGQPAPNFDMQFFNGYEWEQQTVADLNSMRGKVVVLNFWASWCVECRLEANLLEQSWRKYRDQGVVFLGVAYADAEPKSLAYLEEFDITYPNAPDLGTRVAADYEVTGVPETFFIGRDGAIAHVQIGPVNQTTMDSVLAQLIAQ